MKEKNPENIWTIFNEGNLFIIHSKELNAIRILKNLKIGSLENKKILEVGCGRAFELRNFLRYGAKPQNLFGIDLKLKRMQEARSMNPIINYNASSVQNLPFKENTFDIVLAFTLFSSILNKDCRIKAANEMLRVLKNDGTILFYDLFIRKPKNKNVVGINKREIKELFLGCSFYFKKITLIAPLARIIPSFLLTFYYLFEKLWFLNTHYLVAIKKSKDEN